jgi:hypothetical protein
LALAARSAVTPPDAGRWTCSTGERRGEEEGVHKATELLARRVAEQIAKQRARKAVPQADELADDLMDGKVISDEDGHPFGTMHRLRDVSVFVVADRLAAGATDLEHRLQEPSTRLIVRTDDKRVTDVIFVLAPTHPPTDDATHDADSDRADRSVAAARRPEAVRSDEV